MRKLFKFLLWLLAILIVLIVIAYLMMGTWVKTAVNTVVPKMTKTAVNLEKVDISLFKGQVSLQGFRLGNPAGFTNPNAFEVGEVFVKFEPKSVFSSKIIINEIRVNGTKVDAELNKMGNMNLMVLSDNIQEYLTGISTSKAAKSPTQIEQKKGNNSGKAVVVRDLRISNSSLSFGIMGQGMKVSLPDIHEKNIGEKKKSTLADLFFEVYNRLTIASLEKISQSGQAALNSMLSGLKNQVKGASAPAKDLKNQLKQLF